MKSAPLALLALALVLGLALGLGGGLVLGEGGGPPALAATADPRGLASGPPVEGQDPSPVRLDTDGLARGTRPGPSEPSGPSPAARRAASRAVADAASPDEDTSAWDGVVTGKVLDPAGAPIAGAVVVSYNSYRDSRHEVRGETTEHVGRGYEGLGDVEESLAGEAERALRTKRNERRAEVGADGRFRLEGLRPGMQRLLARAEGFVFDSVECRTGEEALIVGTEVSVFRLDVRLPDGSAPEVAYIATESRNRSEQYLWTPERPELRLASPTLAFRAYAGDVQKLDWRNLVGDHVSAEVSLNLELDGEGPHLVQLEAAQMVRVRVHDTSSARPRVDAWVRMVADEGSEPEEDAWFRGGNGRATSLTQGKDEVFVAKDLAAGRYWLAVGRGDRTPEVVEPVEVTPGVTEVSVEVGELDMGRFLVIECRTPTGRPALDVDFTARVARKSGGTSSGDVSHMDRGQGTYWIARSVLLHDAAPDEIERVELTAVSPAFGSAEFEVEPDAASHLVNFSAPADLLVLVTGDVSAGFAVHLTAVDGDGKSEPSGWFRVGHDGSERVGLDGRTLFAGIQPARYTVRLHRVGREDYGGQSLPVASAELEVVPGRNELTLAVPALHEVRVHAPDGSQGQHFQLSAVRDGSDGEDWRGMHTQLGEDKRATFTGVPAGTYTLRSWGGAGMSMPMTVVVPGGEVVWDPPKADCLRISDVEADSAAAKAGLLDGDLVTAVDGKAFESPEAVQMIPMRLRGEALSFTVQRGAQTFEVKLGPVASGPGGGPWGFQLQPHTR